MEEVLLQISQNCGEFRGERRNEIVGKFGSDVVQF